MTAETAPSPRFPWWYRRPELLDRVTLLLSVGSASVGSVAMLADGHSWTALLSPALVAVGALVSRRAPRSALLVIAAAPLLCAALGIDPTFAWSLVVLSSPLLVHRGAPAPLVAVVGAAANGAAAGFAAGNDVDLLRVVLPMALAVAATTTTSALQKQAGYLRAMEQRAEDALEARDREAQRRVIEERLRIARDLHDVVGHHVAIVSVQLSMAEVASGSDPAQTRRALGEARRGIQAILHDMQRILEVLRVSGDDDARQPTGGIDGLPALIESFRQIGLAVDAELAPLGESVDAAVDAAVFRTVQEALTNAQRYGDGSARVTLSSDPLTRTLELRISNTVGDTTGTGSGYGLLGMRERIESAGGRLDLTERDGRFEVAVRLHIDGGKAA